MRHAFFSFDYRDVWTTNVVRNSWVTQDPQAAGFLDKSLWEESKQKSDAAIKKLIDGGLQGTSVTVVLIGPRTASRKYVRYEMERSLARGNGFVAVHVGGIKDACGRTRRRGANPLHSFFEVRDGTRVRLSDIYPTYDWIADEGFKNLGRWVDEAAVKAGRPESKPSSGGRSDGWLLPFLGVVAGIVGGVIVVAGLVWLGGEVVTRIRASRSSGAL